MAREKTEIMDKEKCDRLMNEIHEDKKLLSILHKVMINAYLGHKGLNKIIEMDDFKSECFMKIYKSLDLYDEEKSSIKCFCIMCIKTTALLLLRKGRATKNLLLNSDYTVSLEAQIYDTDECYFDDILEAKEDEYFVEDFKKELIEAINKLAPRQKQIVLLKMKGYSNREIAEIANIKEHSVASFFYKSKNILKKHLNFDGEFYV